jgi:hypothetical protein
MNTRMRSTAADVAESAAGEALSFENPWPGLSSFREEDQEFFRGRIAEAEALQRLVNRERLTVLFGVSGLGKSSLLQAGLFPRLRAELFLPVYIRLDYSEGAQPLRQQVLDALAREAVEQGVESPPYDPRATLWEQFHRQGTAYWSADNRPVTPLIAFDQFEEAFTIGRASPAHAQRTRNFLEELADLIEGRPSAELKAQFDAGAIDPKAFVFNRHPYKLLLSIREDFLAELESLREKIPSLGSNRMRLTPLKGDSAFQVTQVAGPALVPPEVGDRIVRFVAGDQTGGAAPLAELNVDPALLSLFCSELNERRKRLGRDSIGADLLQGSQVEILSSYYERSFAGLAPGVRRFVEEELITDSGYRDSTALEGALRQPGVTRGAIDTLIARRLIHLEERLGAARVELTHDVLTRIVQASRDRRRLEEAQKEESERELRRLAAERERARAWRRRLRLTAAGVGLFALAGVAVWVQADARIIEARDSEERAREQARVMSDSAEAAKAEAAALKAEADARIVQANTAAERAAEAVQRAAQAQAAAASAERRATVVSEEATRLRQIGVQHAAAGRATRAAAESIIEPAIARADSVREAANARADSVSRAAEDRIRSTIEQACEELERDPRAEETLTALRRAAGLQPNQYPCEKTS